MYRLIDLGVDGLMTDKPTVLKEALVARNLFQLSGTFQRRIKPGINKINKLNIPMLGLPVNKAIPETMNGPKNTEDLPIKL